MKFLSPIIGGGSGSVAGSTYSRNRYGNYIRNRAVPVNPSSTFQQQVRSVFTALVNAWTETLTAPQRNGWELYAANVTWTDPLGQVQNVTGQNVYIALNSPRLHAATKLGIALSRVDDAPVIFDRGEFTDPTATFSEASGVDFEYTDTDAWATEVGGAMLFFQGRPQNASRNFYGGPYRLVGGVAGAVSPPTSPLTVGAVGLALAGFAIAEDQRQFWVACAMRADGRLTTRRRYTDSVEA